MIKIIIRDDDLNFHTTVADIKKSYENFIGVIPISFACVPFVHSSLSDMQTHILGRNNIEKMNKISEYEFNYSFLNEKFMGYTPIGYNDDIIKYISILESKGMASIMLHGISHRFTPLGPELNSGKDYSYELQASKYYLEEVFGCPLKYLVPPSNNISSLNFKKLADLNLGLVSSSIYQCNNLKDRFIRDLLTLSNKDFIINRFVNKTTLFSRSYFDIPVFLGPTFDVNDTCDTFLARWLPHIEKNEIGIIATHYTDLHNKDYQAEFFKMIKYFQLRNDVKFVRINDL